MPKLDVLSAGVIRRTQWLSLTQSVWSLIDNFSEQYDFVIIDALLVLAADAVTLGKMTDGVLLITRPGVVDSPCYLLKSH